MMARLREGHYTGGRGRGGGKEILPCSVSKVQWQQPKDPNHSPLVLAEVSLEMVPILSRGHRMQPLHLLPLCKSSHLPSSPVTWRRLELKVGQNWSLSCYIRKRKSVGNNAPLPVTQRVVAHTNRQCWPIWSDGGRTIVEWEKITCEVCRGSHACS